MANDMNDMNVMDWGDTLHDDGIRFVILPEGDYPFTISNFERGRHGGSAKLPACPKAILTLKIESDRGTATVRVDLFLYRSVQWRLVSFFKSIGAKADEKGDVEMDWNHVIGAKGRVRIRPRTYVGRDGQTKESNEVVSFLDPAATSNQPAPASAAFTQVSDPDLPWNNGGF